MSVMVCDFCTRYIDTDYDVEGEVDDKSNLFMCSHCCCKNDIESSESLAAHIALESQP